LAERVASRLSVSFPFVVGHEYAGTIDKVAPDVEGFAPGDRVSMETHIFCGKCFHCLNGMAHNCTSTGVYGLGYGGSFAEYCIAPARVIFKLPDKVSFEEGAIFEPAGVAMRAVVGSYASDAVTGGADGQLWLASFGNARDGLLHACYVATHRVIGNDFRVV
jgi:threonine 3-dehydrogenase